MKSRLILLAALLALPLAAEEANPFVKKKDEAKKTEPPPGPAFVGILEHVLVPPDLIDAWIKQHGMPADATALRAEVQKWVEEKKASLDCTMMGSGVMGRISSNERILERIYPTEYMEAGAGVWPYATAFETRNLGYTAEFISNAGDGKVRLSVDADFCEMQGSNPWNVIVEKTRQPDDVFMPVIRTYRLLQKGPAIKGKEVVDPFADPQEASPISMHHQPSFESDGVHLLARFDPLSVERKRGLPSRLIFARGSAAPEVGKTAPLAEDFAYTVATIRVPHVEFSSWLQSQQPLAVQMGAWSFAETLCKDGKAEVVESAGSRGNVSKHNLLENISEIIYPTEYEPSYQRTVTERWEERERRNVDGKPVEGVATRATVKIDAVPGLAGASTATSFETRNTGMTYELEILPDENGILAKHVLERVIYVGESVHRRIEDQGKWIPDITMPIFSTCRFNTTNRLQPGKWTLIATGPEYAENGKTDREQCLLMFVKVE